MYTCIHVYMHICIYAYMYICIYLLLPPPRTDSTHSAAPAAAALQVGRRWCVVRGVSDYNSISYAIIINFCHMLVSDMYASVRYVVGW